LTKLHETFHRGVLGGTLTPPLVDKGEVVVVVEGGDVVAHDTAPLDVTALANDASLSPKERARRLAQAQGISVREAYARLQQAQGKSDVAEVRRALSLAAEAAVALLSADDTARAARQGAADPSEAAGSDIPGADALLRLLARPSSLAAPVEAAEAARALLGAVSALDALLEAIDADADE
jgi:hypothetical protein